MGGRACDGAPWLSFALKGALGDDVAIDLCLAPATAADHRRFQHTAGHVDEHPPAQRDLREIALVCPISPLGIGAAVSAVEEERSHAFAGEFLPIGMSGPGGNCYAIRG